MTKRHTLAVAVSFAICVSVAAILYWTRQSSPQTDLSDRTRGSSAGKNGVESHSDADAAASIGSKVSGSREDSFPGVDDSLVQIYSARTWRDVLEHSRSSEFSGDSYKLLSAVLSLCTADRYGSVGKEYSSESRAFLSTPPVRRSVAMAIDAGELICDGFDRDLVADRITELDGSGGGELPTLESLLLERSPSRYEDVGTSLARDSLLPEVESRLGIASLQQDRQYVVRLAAVSEARCQLFPGCAPGSIYTLAGCLPDQCSAGVTFSSRFMQEHLQPNEQVQALRLASALIAARRNK